jgi:endonuclease-3
MTREEFIKAWPILTREVEKLHIPWLENVATSQKDPFKILISCILSLRTQDKVTGEASERIFQIASTPEALSKLPVERIERAIYPAGFYRVKARRIKKMCRAIVRRYASRVPDTIEELLAFEGVGRKTANLVITLGYDKDGICVDTHVHRIVNRWGIVKTKTPAQTEFALRKTLPVRFWKKINGILVAYGQRICTPISPRCSTCKIYSFCNRIGVVKRR